MFNLQNRISFLDLPSEIRNIIYQDSSIYTALAEWHDSWQDTSEAPRGSFFSDLGQPPITRVNRQIRNETLPIFYGNHRFVIHLPRLPRFDIERDGRRKDPNRLRSVWDRLFARHFKAPENLSENEDPLHHLRVMLHAFTPALHNTLQANSLSFLSNLTFRLEFESLKPSWGLLGLGCTMSSRELHCDDGDEILVKTVGLDWNSAMEVREAFVVAIASSKSVYGAIDFLDWDVVLHPEVEKAVRESAALMCCISRECPQLTGNVLAFITPSELYYNRLLASLQ